VADLYWAGWSAPGWPSLSGAGLHWVQLLWVAVLCDESLAGLFCAGKF
jgi:hypothetical protein